MPVVGGRHDIKIEGQTHVLVSLFQIWPLGHVHSLVASIQVELGGQRGSRMRGTHVPVSASHVYASPSAHVHSLLSEIQVELGGQGDVKRGMHVSVSESHI